MPKNYHFVWVALTPVHHNSTNQMTFFSILRLKDSYFTQPLHFHIAP